MLSVHSMDFITSNNVHWMITSEGSGKTYILKRNFVGFFKHVSNIYSAVSWKAVSNTLQNQDTLGLHQ